MEKKRLKIGVIFSCYVVLIPILEYYKSPLDGFNMATFLAMAFLVLFAVLVGTRIAREWKISLDGRMIPVWVYIAFMTFSVLICFSLYDYKYTWDNLSSYVRLLVLFFSILVLGHHYFDFSVAMKFLEKLLVFCALLIFVQDVLFIFFDIGVNINIPSLLMNRSYAVYPGRPGGLYMEPAHYAQSAVLYICMFMFGNRKALNLSWKSFVIIGLGVVASGSGQGYLVLGLVYFLWVLDQIRLKNVTSQRLILASLSVVAVASACFVLLQIPFFEGVVSRFMGEDGSLGGLALKGRTYTNALFKKLSETQQLFGVGFGFTKVVTVGYVNSLYSHLIQCGYLSLIPLGVIFAYLFFKGSSYVKAFTVLYAVMICFSGVATPMALCFYLSFLLFERPMSKKRSLR